MRLAVFGSRGFIDYERLCLGIANLGDTIECIVSGGARGADTLAARFAKENGIKLFEFLPDYEKYGRSAPIVRNRSIVDNADCVLAFWDGKSHGTKFVIEECKKRRVPVQVFLNDSKKDK